MHFAFGIIHGAGLLLFITQASLGERWRHEFEDEQPIDLESSGDDYFLEDDEIDDGSSASGSGYFEQETGLDLEVRFTTETPIAPPTATALKPAPTVHTPPPTRSTWYPPMAQSTVVHLNHPWMLPDATETPFISASPESLIPTKEAVTTAAATPETARTTEVRRLQPVIVVATPTPRSTEEEIVTVEATDGQFVSIASQASGKVWPTEDEGMLTTSSVDKSKSEDDKMLPTQQTQTDNWQVTAFTAHDSDFEIPVSGGPSGDFEIPEEDGGSQTEPPTILDIGNEVLPPGTSPSDPGRGRKPDSGLIDNTIDSGNTLAQMPQKNILERREVLIAVIVGGVVGALFAAFLVMLLIYRMKKKDEGSYALEEPKPASVSYQKPDNHEEFYA
ncbi:syndecan-3 [Spea bombifrons]|uniref:syndecan-3 n=1 Tax=Spea bombifrons TaxID=233779 RepID=UPI00234BF76D|nr:syndecan-3 [Spea bombifrons]